MTRKLAAIIAADVVGYSRLMGGDEAGTLAALKTHRRELIDPKIAEHQGRIVKTTGDGLLIEFPSVVEAVQCAIEVQRAMQDRNTNVPKDHRIEFRVGINLGDIIIDGDDIYGDGEDLGERQLKNIARPVHVFRIAASGVGQPMPSAKAALALPDKPSIAVLPFTNMSGDPEQEYFSDGITEDVITALSRLHWFFVIARNSTFAYKGKPVDVKHLGQELGVRYVLEGSVRKSGQRVRITSQLIDATTNNHIWAERYDRELSDIFALQDEITASVAAAIEPKLLAAEGIRAESRSIEDLNAWDLVARAVSHFWKLTAAESATAIAMLRQAVQRYPDYAPAHSMLAFALVVSAHLGWTASASDRAFAAECALRAAELDDQDPWAHVALGYLAFTARQTDEAIGCFRRALALNPNFAAAHGYIGFALACDGRSEDAIENSQRAIRMSPRDPLNFFFVGGLAAAHYLAGRYVEAVDWARQQVQMRPGSPSGHRILCASLAQAGLIEEARAAMRLLRQVQPNISVAWIKASVPYPDHTMPRFLEGLRKAGLTE